MEQSELETLVEELETRVDRLRALYDQYFMGIERIIPAVPHKDVERRLYVLRRQTIRNTGLRFRFQNVLLRFNTYQTYWMRITRQIEEGTYKRDIRRANARFATAPKVDREAVDVTDEIEVDVDLEGEVSSFEDEELARAKEQVARMREVLRASTPPKPPPLPSAPRSREAPSRDEPATEPSGGAARPPTGGLKYAVRGKKSTSDLPPPLPVARTEVDLDDPFAPETKPREPPRPKRTSARPVVGAPPVRRRASSRPAASETSAPTARDAAPPRPAFAAAPAKPPPQPSSLSDERVRQIYSQYVEAKRKVGESTAALTFEGLSRSLKDSTAKLKEKHGGKSIDFEVTVKDGKAVLRPVVR